MRSDVRLVATPRVVRAPAHSGLSVRPLRAGALARHFCRGAIGSAPARHIRRDFLRRPALALHLCCDNVGSAPAQLFRRDFPRCPAPARHIRRDFLRRPALARTPRCGVI
ncbi:MAG TPA: hypothetical protein PKA88_35750 [Polyangiaceae bacterium]|nr:hypothetical protein [Polyangiaceae bacterium]